MDKKYSFFEKIFSVTNQQGHKQIYIFGIKIKFIRKYRNKHLYENLPLENNKIIFISCLNGYNCNPKYITEEIIKRKLPYKLVWVVSQTADTTFFPKSVKLVEQDSEECLKEFATAKMWIANERIKSCVNKGLYKRTEQIYINTWHGSVGGKKCTSDRGTLSKGCIKPYIVEAKQLDYLFSNSEYENDFMKRLFWNNGEILQFGHARNDILFNIKTQKIIKQKIFSYFNINPEKRIVLYAPTFRDNKDLSHYTLDYNKLKSVLSKKYGGSWEVLTRLHPQLYKQKDSFIFDPNTINVTDYPDMQELLVVSDVLITDYSSCIFDFMFLERPGFIFATDIEEYTSNRGLYDSLTSTPFPVATDNNQLTKNILNFDEIEYKKEIKLFLEKKGCTEDGHATERIVNFISEKMKT